LFGFQKVFLEPGQSVELYFAALPKVFHLVDNQVCMYIGYMRRQRKEDERTKHPTPSTGKLRASIGNSVFQCEHHSDFACPVVIVEKLALELLAKMHCIITCTISWV
jgi:hypothetical protein